MVPNLTCQFTSSSLERYWPDKWRCENTEECKPSQPFVNPADAPAIDDDVPHNFEDEIRLMEDSLDVFGRFLSAFDGFVKYRVSLHHH